MYTKSKIRITTHALNSSRSRCRGGRGTTVFIPSAGTRSQHLLPLDQRAVALPQLAHFRFQFTTFFLLRLYDRKKKEKVSTVQNYNIPPLNRGEKKHRDSP